jgi:hypothetical protein
MLRCCWNLLFHNSGYPRVSNGWTYPCWTSLLGPFTQGHQTALRERVWHTPAGNRNRDGQTTHSYALVTGGAGQLGHEWYCRPETRRLLKGRWAVPVEAGIRPAGHFACARPRF